jgi:hypothetical protein
MYDFYRYFKFTDKIKNDDNVLYKVTFNIFNISNTLAQNLVTFQHIHTILKSTCS